MLAIVLDNLALRNCIPTVWPVDEIRYIGLGLYQVYVPFRRQAMFWKRKKENVHASITNICI